MLNSRQLKNSCKKLNKCSNSQNKSKKRHKRQQSKQNVCFGSKNNFKPSKVEKVSKNFYSLPYPKSKVLSKSYSQNVYLPSKYHYDDDIIADKVNCFYQHANKQYYLPETSQSLKKIGTSSQYYTQPYPQNKNKFECTQSQYSKCINKKDKKIKNQSIKKIKTLSTLSLQHNNVPIGCQNTDLANIYKKTQKILDLYSEREIKSKKQKQKLLKQIAQYRKLAKNNENQRSKNNQQSTKKNKVKSPYLTHKVKKIKMLYSVKL